MQQENLIRLCDALFAFLEPFGEVVAHDLETGTICYIRGHLSGRAAGYPSYLEDLQLDGQNQSIFGPYSKTNPDGRLVKSISVLLKDGAGEPATLLCINMDASHFERAALILTSFVKVAAQDQDNPFTNDWLEQLNKFVASWLLSEGLSASQLTAEHRRRLLAALRSNGVFDRPKAAAAVAAAISVSRATVFQDLKKIGELNSP